MALNCLEIAAAAGLAQARRSGKEILFRCPRHDDHHPSLSVNPAKDVFLCGPCGSAGNPWAFAAFLSRLSPDDKPGVTAWLRDKGLLSINGGNSNRPERRIVATYPYRDRSGDLLFEVVRYEPKEFRQRRPDGIGGWIYNREGVEPVIYRLPELLAADPSETLFIPEGEKDVEALLALGLVATCNPGGAGKWRNGYSECLRDRDVVLLPDNDDAGRRNTQQVATVLSGVARSMRVLGLPGLLEKGDVSDWLTRGGTREQLQELARKTPEAKTEKQRNFSPQWPEPLPNAAFHGLAGEIVRVIEPHTESDPAALLLQLLVFFGLAVGREPYFVAEADRHYFNLFIVIVGNTSKGRKGTSWGHTVRMFERLPAWSSNLIKSGLSSGEGLIWAVRDPQEEVESTGKEGVIGSDIDSPDDGVAEKRLLAYQPEFASTLRILGRDGNTLSATLRQAWDTGRLSILTKNSPASATGAHISFVAHITCDELRRYLDRTETGNGFANRFLFICAKRSKILPEGGNLDPDALLPFVHRLSEAVSSASTVDEMRRDEEARAVWREVYGELSEGALGLFGAVTSRAEAQVVRLSGLYALLDKSPVIRREHLEAALAVWDYAESSARFIFGDSLGDPTADELLRALQCRPNGMTRTEIRDLFSKNKNSGEIGRALDLLVQHGLARCAINHTDGRPAERWFAMRGSTT